jgi:hypothetical protein
MQFAKYQGGRLIQNAEVTAIFLGGTFKGGLGDWSTDPLFKGYACGLNAFLDDILDSAYIDQLTQYNSPDGVYRIGRGRRVNSIVIPFSDTQGDHILPLEVQGYLESGFLSGLLPAPNENSVYLLYIPPQFTTGDSRFDYISAATGKDVVGGTIDFAPNINSDNPVAPVDPLGTYAYWSTHQLVEIITSPDGESGWIALQEHEGQQFVSPIASGTCFMGIQEFHGYKVALIWDQSGVCSCPPDDGMKKPPRSVTIAISSRACYPTTVEGSNATFEATLNNYPPGAVVKYVWTAGPAPATVVSSKGSTSVVKVPPFGTQFTVSVTAVDVFGCPVSNSLSLSPSSNAFAEFVERLCVLRRLILKYWWLEPIWGSDRDLGSIKLEERDIVRLEKQAEEFVEHVKGIRSSFDRMDKAPKGAK